MGYTLNDKKKKPYDPVANPALVFKRKKPRGVSTDGQGGSLGKKTVHYQSNNQNE